LELSWPDEVPGRMLSVGSSIEVLEPIEIRDRVIATARRIVARYGRDEPVEARDEVVQARAADASPAVRAATADASVTGA
jgi:hypothetical protein